MNCNSNFLAQRQASLLSNCDITTICLLYRKIYPGYCFYPSRILIWSEVSLDRLVNLVTAFCVINWIMFKSENAQFLKRVSNTFNVLKSPTIPSVAKYDKISFSPTVSPRILLPAFMLHKIFLISHERPVPLSRLHPLFWYENNSSRKQPHFCRKNGSPNKRATS